MTIDVAVSTKDPFWKVIEYSYSFWPEVQSEMWRKYGNYPFSKDEAKEFVNKVVKTSLAYVQHEIAVWLLDDLYQRIFSDKFEYDYRKEEFLEDTTIIDVNKELRDMLVDLIGLGIYLPYTLNEYDMTFFVETISQYGVEAYLDKMEEKLKRIAENLPKTEEEQNREDVKQLIIEEAKLHPVSAQELAQKYNMTLVDVERILRKAGAIYDEYDNKWWIPSSEAEEKALECLINYARTNKTFKLGFDEAKKVLMDCGFTEDEASALIVDLSSKGVIQLYNGIVTIPQVKAEVLGQKVAEEGGGTSEDIIEQLTDELVVELLEDKITPEELAELYSKFARELNKATFEKICRGVFKKLDDVAPETAKKLREWFKENLGTYDCRKIYDKLKQPEEEE
jgi:hypothetical protein